MLNFWSRSLVLAASISSRGRLFLKTCWSIVSCGIALSPGISTRRDELGNDMALSSLGKHNVECLVACCCVLEALPNPMPLSAGMGLEWLGFSLNFKRRRVNSKDGRLIEETDGG